MTVSFRETQGKMSDLRFDEMTYPDFCHDGDSHCVHNFLDHGRIALQS